MAIRAAVDGLGICLDSMLLAEQELRSLSSTLQQSRVQAKRMENFSFEPVSLPPSRVSTAFLFRVTSSRPLT